MFESGELIEIKTSRIDHSVANFIRLSSFPLSCLYGFFNKTIHL